MRWPFTGRDGELRLVGDALSGRSTSGVVIAGPAGVGKTRLAAEAAALAGEQGCAVEWVRASRSARTIPLGAFATLLPAGAGGLADGVELLGTARDVLRERAAGRRVVLCVDDGQLLDGASAALVLQLATAGDAFVVVSVRRDEPAPDALRALWKDELCLLLELAELSRDDVDRLLAAALGGPVDGRSVNALWELTRGNALFLRELVRHGVDRGLLGQDGGLWRWRGEVRAGTRLAELVDVRIDDAGEGARRMLELVAVAAPLPVGLLEPGELAALEGLERAELAQRRPDERRRLADVAHPLHGEAVRARLTPTRADAIRTRLADAVQAHGARRGGDLLRIAVWRLEAGAAGDPELFARAAAQAMSAPDAALAERLARAAVQAGAGFGARLTLARALAGSGAAAEAQALLDELAAQARDDRERAAVATASARNLFWALHRAADAGAVLRDAERHLGDAALRHELDRAARALHGRRGTTAGHPRRRRRRSSATTRSTRA